MIQIGTGLPPVSDEPLEHLVACHDRILSRVATLERVASSFETQPEAAVAALESAVRFLDTSGRLHTDDEEESVFPRLRERASAEEREYLDSLEAQHDEKERVFAELKTLAHELREAITPERTAKYRLLAGRLCELYRAHIASENDVLMDLGRRKLGEDELAAILTEMRSRRHS
jgi:hemerythrin-like domain-containing protein